MQTLKFSMAREIITRLAQIQEEIGELVEELEILSNDDLRSSIEKSEKDFEAGRYYSFEEIQEIHKKLGKK